MIGCGDETCTQPSCWTRRRCKSRKPLRKLSKHAAQATALALAEQPDAIFRLCCFAVLDEKASSSEPDGSDEISNSSLERKAIDEKSINQNSAHTNIMKSAFDACASADTNNNVALQILNASVARKSRLESWSDVAPARYSAIGVSLTKELIPAEEASIDRNLLVHVGIALFRNPYRLFESFRDMDKIDLVESVSANSDPKLEFSPSCAKLWNASAKFPHLDPCRLLDVLKLWVGQLGQLVLECLSDSLNKIDKDLVSLVDSGRSDEVAHVFFICVYTLHVYCGSIVEDPAICQFHVLDR